MGDHQPQAATGPRDIQNNSTPWMMPRQVKQPHLLDLKIGMQIRNDTQKPVAFSGRPSLEIAMQVTQPRYRLHLSDIKNAVMGCSLFIGFLKKQGVGIGVPNLIAQHVLRTGRIDPAIVTPATMNVPADARDDIGAHGDLKLWEKPKWMAVLERKNSLISS